MAKRFLLILAVFSAFLFTSIRWTSAQEGETSIRVEVDLVQLNVAVTDSKGNYVTGLKPSDFQITEDTIPEKIAFFGEGNGPARSVVDIDQSQGKPLDAAFSARETTTTPPEQTDNLSAAIAGSNVFILF